MITIVGQFLAGDNQFGTLANLNVASRFTREATNIPLWTSVILDSKLPSWGIEGYASATLPDNMDHITPDLLPNSKYVR
jgi:hypothetical protein